MVCVDGCQLARSHKVAGMMIEACTWEQLLGSVGLAQGHVGRTYVEAGVCSFVMATCVCLAPCAGMGVLCSGKKQPSARCGDTCVIEGPAEGMKCDSSIVILQ